MANNSKLTRMVGMAKRAGKLDIGESRAEDRIRSGESFLVILSSDASANTKKKFNNMCNFRELPLIELWDRNVLGHCIGREFAVVISVADEGFAKQIIALNEIEVSEFGTAECNTPLNIERID